MTRRQNTKFPAPQLGHGPRPTNVDPRGKPDEAVVPSSLTVALSGAFASRREKIEQLGQNMRQ